MLFLEYPKCSTCKKAKKWLDEQGISYEDRHIIEDNPTVEELKDWHERSGLPLKRFFNTSGMKYRELGLKDKLPEMSEEEQYELIGEKTLRPIINVQPDRESVYHELEQIVLHPERIAPLKRQSKEYVSKYHDYIQVSRQYEDFYRSLLK